MDPVRHPLDWWAYGGYKEVIRQTGWNLPKARREVKKVMHEYGWHPIGHRGYEELRKEIMAAQLFNWDLT